MIQKKRNIVFALMMTGDGLCPFLSRAVGCCWTENLGVTKRYPLGKCGIMVNEELFTLIQGNLVSEALV